jgi:hypothetical protein
MIQPIPLDVILREYPQEYKVWVIQARNGNYLVIPDNRFPSRRPILFFKSEYDASRLLDAALTVRPFLVAQGFVAIEVRLLEVLRRLAAEKNWTHANRFVVYSPSEVSECISKFKAKAVK